MAVVTSARIARPPRPEIWGTMPDGRPVSRLAIGGSGLRATLMTFGAGLHDLRLEGHDHNMVVSLPSLAEYLADTRYIGVTVGRFANRIGGAAVQLDGKEYALDPNYLGRHTLHGGSDGSGRRNWTLDRWTADSATFRDRLPDGHMGFPGAVDVELEYRIEDGATLALDFTATAEAPTPCSFAHHGFFNLGSDTSLDEHDLRIDATRYLPVDADLIPLGAPAAVDGTRFDFRTSRSLPRDRHAPPIDHNFCLSDMRVPIRTVALLRSRKTGLEMRLSTDQPGLQVFDGLVPSVQGGVRSGIALEPQSWPDPFGRPGYPTAILRPREIYRQLTTFAFRRDDVSD